MCRDVLLPLLVDPLKLCRRDDGPGVSSFVRAGLVGCHVVRKVKDGHNNVSLLSDVLGSCVVFLCSSVLNMIMLTRIPGSGCGSSSQSSLSAVSSSTTDLSNLIVHSVLVAPRLRECPTHSFGMCLSMSFGVT